MIIRFTFSDNDFTYVLENFLDKAFINLKYCLKKYSQSDNPIDIMRYCDRSKAFDKYFKLIADEKIFTKQQKENFTNLITESLLDYIKDNYNNKYDYLAEVFSIKLLTSIKDRWENGEAVYYFIMHDKYITM